MRALLALLCLLPTMLWADGTRPYRAEYQVQNAGKTIGGGYYELVELGDNHYRLGFQSDGSLLMFLSDTRTANSEFQRIDGEIVPLQYSMERSGSGRDFGASARFNHDTGTIDVRYKDRQAQFELVTPIYDELLYQQQLREDLAAGKIEMHYQVVFRHKIREYHYRVLKKETLDLPLGSLETIKVERVRDPSKKKKTYVWVVPSMDYIVAKLADIGGDFDTELHLENVQFHDSKDEATQAAK